MRDSATFIRKKRSRLTIKYMRRSLQGLSLRPSRPSDVQDLQRIDEFYKKFIELPYN